MLLSELLRPDLIKIGLAARNRNEAIGELVDLLVQQHEIPMSKRQRILDLLLEGEDEHGTGMEHGIAVPHVGTDEVDDILCALGTSRDGVPFETLDGQPADLIILFVMPKRNFVGMVRSIAILANLLGHEKIKDKIVAAPTPQAVYDLIEEEERRVES